MSFVRGLTRAVIPALAVVGVLASAQPAAAQSGEPPIGPFVVDLRGSFAPYGQNEVLATSLGVDRSDLAGRGLGLDIGGHLYFFRWRAITFGVGGSFQFSRGEHQRQEDPEQGFLEGPRVRTQLKTVVPQVSFNFGTGRGWSYVSGGISPVRLSVTVDGVERQTRSTKTINYGGGARWFTSQHLAFSLDLRFYAMNPLPPEGAFIGLPRMTLTVISVGVSFK